MGVEWTQKQLDVINTRGRNILVSAAAGSGKTAVLVERIIQKITDSDNPIDVDKLLVVTFTKAAAAEMRERVLVSLEKALEAEPLNENLQRQQTYIHNAQITTIDSFCAHVVRENFDKIALDPNTRIVDEAEITMLQNDVLNALLEEKFQSGEETFYRLADKYSNHKSSRMLNDLILTLYNAAVSHVQPKRWLNECREPYEIESIEDAENSEWMKKLKFFVAMDLDGIKSEVKEALHIVEGTPELDKYKTDIVSIQNMIERINVSGSFEELSAGIHRVEFGRLPAVRGVSDEKAKEKVKELRDDIKKKVSSIKSEFFAQSIDEIINDIKESKETVNTLIDITLEFYDRFAREKVDKCIMDFADQEHYALDILVDFDADGNYVPSAVAQDLSTQFEEIMIDEYQDSNFIQEAILTSVANGFGTGNVFMVGDVKQSIYRFRLAKPQLFIDKFNRYEEVLTDLTKEDLTKEACKIILDKNFRSRHEIIDSVNFIFRRIMNRELGGIDYEDGNRMDFGATYYLEPDKDQDNSTELLLVEGDGDENEVRSIAKRIKELVSGSCNFKVTAKDGFRTPNYSDIVILLRSVKTRADAYVKILNEEGIPAYSETKTGYYDAKEVRQMLDYLSVIDNPLQDIPFASIMRSEIYQFTSEELAIIKAENDGAYFYENVKRYAENGQEEGIVTKINRLLRDLDNFRKIVPYTSVYDLLNQVLSKTGYEDYVSALPNGARRVKNLDILREKANAFDAGTYKGLFNFIRYIGKIKEMGLDEGEASPYSENDNLVRIMTFHKSKGLQFPIVFVSGLGTRFNHSDTSAPVIAHDEFGIGVDYLDDELKVKKSTMIKSIIKKIVKEENYAEYIRFLYVAMTRAQEKMILTASDKNMYTKVTRWIDQAKSQEDKVKYAEMMGSGTFIDWLGMAVSGNQAFDGVRKQFGEPIELLHPTRKEDSCMSVQWIAEDAVEAYEDLSALMDYSSKQIYLDWDTDVVYDEKIKEMLEKNIQWSYPHHELAEIPAKLTVTEIKKLSMPHEEEESGQILYERHTEPEELIPKFMDNTEKQTVMTGAKRGTAYHRVFELFDFEMVPTKENICNMLKNLVESGKLSAISAECIDVNDFVRFAESNLYQRMKRAYDNHCLYRERSFLMGIPASKIKAYAQYDSDEMILVQGIIDVCFLEDGNFIIADYKTDNVASMQELVDRYAVQLDSYKYAIDMLDGIHVSEKIIYSVKFGSEIEC